MASKNKELNEIVKQNVTYYNLDAIISVGYRVNSAKATKFRIWRQITDIFAECSIDYDRNSETTKQFYATVQNKFHYAINGQAWRVPVENIGTF